MPDTKTPRTWLLLGDKVGDNAQVAAIAACLPWPVEERRLVLKPEWVLGKPAFKPTLRHLDPDRSDRLAPPWPDLVLTIGRRPSMAALWLKERSPSTRLVLVGRPKRWPERFDLIVAPPQMQVPSAPNVVPLRLPLLRPDAARVAAEAAAWRDALAPMPRPLTALMVGGPTMPYRLDAAVAAGLLQACLADGGSLYITTSRRTPPEVVRTLRDFVGAADPAKARLYAWGDAGPNPYHALLGLADRFVVTADSVSMQIEAAALGRPLAIAPLPFAAEARRDLLAAVRRLSQRRGPLARLLRATLEGGRFGYPRDLAALHDWLFAEGRAVPLGQTYPAPQAPIPDEAPEVARRVRALVEAEA